MIPCPLIILFPLCHVSLIDWLELESHSPFLPYDISSNRHLQNIFTKIIPHTQEPICWLRINSPFSHSLESKLKSPPKNQIVHAIKGKRLATNLFPLPNGRNYNHLVKGQNEHIYWTTTIAFEHIKETLKCCRKEKNKVGGKILGGLIKWAVKCMR